MKYYKLVDQNNIIGAINSSNFITYSPITDCFMSATDVTGEYASFKGKLYRSSWMQPTKYNFISYQEVNIIEVTQEEYQIFLNALNENEVIENNLNDIERQEAIIYENTVDPIEQISLEFIRVSKLNEMSYACRATIEKGFDLWILDNKYHHFSLTTQDQLNLMSISTQLETAELIPYHADGETSQFYTVEEIKQIIAAATLFKNYHTAYYNALKNYINSLETIEDIAAITYGIKIPDEYQTEVLKTIEQEMISYENH